ncbi:ATP-grasp domain-containing protein [Bradyrhizobium liaoningense]
MILVAGGQLDINVGTFLRRLLHRRIEFIDLLVGPELYPTIVYDLRTGILQLNGRVLRPQASFVRHDVFLQQQTSGRDAAASSLNWFYALKGWELSTPDVVAFNRQSASRENAKIYNLLVAREIGIEIPETVVTNDFYNVERTLSGPLVQKPVAGGEFTTTLDEFLEGLESASTLSRYPRFIQPQLSRPELRIYRIGDAVLSFSLVSDDLDYRKRQQVSLALVPNPPAISQKLITLCDRIDLDFAAADFMRNELTGEWCFLEVNSQPMFAAFDNICNGRLCDAMIDHLLKGAR